MLLMDYTDVGRERLTWSGSKGLEFTISHVAYGTDGYNPGSPGTALPLIPGATALVAEVYRKEVDQDGIIVDDITVVSIDTIVHTSVEGTEFTGVLGEAGLIGTVTNVGTSTATLGEEFLLAQAHFPRVTFHEYARISIPWRVNLFAPTVAQSGDFAFTSITRSTSSEWAGVDVKDDASPATTSIARPGGGGSYGFMTSYQLGLPTFIRTADGNLTGTGTFMSFDRLPDGSFIAVGIVSSGNNLTLRDEAGLSLGTLTVPAGTHNVWSFYCKFSSTGTLLWSQIVDYTSVPVSSFQQTRLLSCTVVGERAYIAGIGRWPTNGASATVAPVFGGLAYPSLPSLSGHSQGAFIVEIDPSDGSGLNIMACDNAASSDSNITQFWLAGEDNRGLYLEPSSDGEHLVLTAAYTGRRLSGTGFLNVGRNKAGSIATRIFADSIADGYSPFIVRLDLDLEPVTVVTQAQDDILSSGSNSRALPGKPVESTAGQLYWSWQTNLNSEGPANTDRHPTNYASVHPNATQGQDLPLISMAASDLGDPRLGDGFSVVLADVLNPTTDGQNANITMSQDESNILLAMRASNPGITTTASFLGDASETWGGLQSWLIAAQADDGTIVWKARLSASAATETAKILYMHQYRTGPYAGEIHCLALIRDNNVATYGAHNASDDALAYDVGSKWANGLVNVSGLSCVMLVYTDAGEVEPTKCFPVFSGSMDFKNVITEFRIF